MDRYLATPIPSVSMTPIESFHHLQSKFCFADETSQQHSFVVPYTIFTDGKEVIIYENEAGEAEIGFKCLVPKAGNSKDFEEVILNAVSQGMNLFFSSIKTRTNIELTKSENVNKSPEWDKIPGEETDLPDGMAGIHSTSRAVYSLDNRFIFPIYFLILPNTKLIKLNPTKEAPKCHTFYLADLTRVGLARFNLSPVAKSILVMIGVGEIVLPIISENRNDITRILE